MRLLKFILKRKLVSDIILVSLLIVLFSYAWRYLLNEVIRGGGYVYLTDYFQGWWWSRQLTFTGFQTAAIISSGISMKLFGVNMFFYFLTEFFVLLLIAVLFYILIRLVTKNALVAFTASLIFSVNYFGNYDMIMACYCYLGERVIVVPFLLASLIFLHFFLERSKKKHFIVSVFFYILGVGLGHFSVLFTAPFLFYPFFWYLFNRLKLTDLIKGSIIGLSYLGLSGFFILIQQINESGFNKEVSLIQYLLNPQTYHYFEYMLRQLVYWSQYPILISAFLEGGKEIHNTVSVLNAIQITPYIVIIYLLASIFICKKLPKYRAMLFTVIFSTSAIFFLNPWFGQYVVATQVGANRYLYFPSFLLSIFWSLFFWAAFFKKKSWKLVIGVFLLAFYCFINIILLRDAFNERQWTNRPTKAITNHFVNMRKNLTKNTLVVGSYPAITANEAGFYTERIGKGEVIFYSEEDPYSDWRKIASISAHVIKVKYDRGCRCIKEERIK